MALKLEPIHLKNAGAKWWHSSDHASPTLTKTSLGSFFYHVLKVGGYIGEIWPFAPQYDRSSVFISVFMTDEMKAKVEAETKFRFNLPPKISLNSD